LGGVLPAGDISCYIGEGIAILSPFLKYTMMLRFLGLGLLLIVFAACLFKRKPQPPPNLEREKLILMDADRAFSKMSEEEGMKAAFMDYIDSNGVLLRPGRYPVVGADAVDFLSQLNDRDYTMQWEPAGVEIAKSGELGYTYGTYKVIYKTGASDSTFYGTYVNVWRRQEDGRWKYVLDSGNEGVGEPVAEDSASVISDNP
jgi:ketosteroid isomerase-like protein